MKSKTVKSLTLPLAPNNANSRTTLPSQKKMERSDSLDFTQTLSIEDWNSIYNQQMDTTPSFSSSLFDICHCCGKKNCENLEYFNQVIKKMESNTRLAAEIGQGLLHKHELYVGESNQRRAALEKQLEEYQEKINELEQSLDQVESNHFDVTKEKNKWYWEYQRGQKMLDQTVSDLETANDKCNQLSKELDSKSNELEKLRLLKFMVRHCESREEALNAKLEDLTQELVIRRKNELLLESKIKKLKTKYENLCNSHEKLLREFEDRMNTAFTVTNTHKTLNHQHSFNTTASNNSDIDTIKHESINGTNNTNDFIDLVKELSLANTKLKLELINCKEQLTESKGEVVTLTQKLDDIYEKKADRKMRLDDDLRHSSSSLNVELNNKSNNLSRVSSANEKKKHTLNSKIAATKSAEGVPIRSKTLQHNPLPTISSSMPTTSYGIDDQSIIHHHYHYLVRKNKAEHSKLTDALKKKNDKDTDKEQYKKLSNDKTRQEPSDETDLVLSPSNSSTIITTKEGTITNTQSFTQSPFIMLQEHIAHISERLKASDIRTLNRRLRRAFDITELSSMSNSIIDNILMDVDTLESRFLWVKSIISNDQPLDQKNQKHPDLVAFFPLLDILKETIKEVGILKSTMNDLQVEYVKKVEESGQRVEDEIIKKRQMRREATKPMSSPPSSRPLSWLTHLFSKNQNKASDSKINHDIHSTRTGSTTTTSDKSSHIHYDKISTCTKTTTNSVHSIPNQEDEEQRNSNLNSRKTLDDLYTTKPHTSRNQLGNNHTFSRQSSNGTLDAMKRRQIPFFPPSNQPPITTSISANTNRSSASIPIRNKRSFHRINIGYEGIGPAAIRPIPSDRDSVDWKSASFSSSWLGGK